MGVNRETYNMTFTSMAILPLHRGGMFFKGFVKPINLFPFIGAGGLRGLRGLNDKGFWGVAFGKSQEGSQHT